MRRRMKLKFNRFEIAHFRIHFTNNLKYKQEFLKSLKFPKFHFLFTLHSRIIHLNISHNHNFNFSHKILLTLDLEMALSNILCFGHIFLHSIRTVYYKKNKMFVKMLYNIKNKMEIKI